MRKRWFFLVLLLALTPFAITAYAAEKTTVGDSCSGDENRADWDAIFQCVSSVWKRAAIWLGSSSDTCGSTKAGIIQWTGTYFQGCDGSSWASMGGRWHDSTTYTSTGTASYTVPDGVTWLKVLAVGGGGGGGAGYSSSNQAGGGGGGGGAILLWQDVFTSGGAVFTVTVGSGGTGSTSRTELGGQSGGTSSFVGGSTAIYAPGGQGGRSAYDYQYGSGGGSGGLGASGGGGAPNVYTHGGGAPGAGGGGGQGAKGGMMYCNSSHPGNACPGGASIMGYAGGAGADSQSGGGGGGAGYGGAGAAGGTSGSNGSNAGANTGAGGGGGGSNASGGNGGSGYVAVRYWQ